MVPGTSESEASARDLVQVLEQSGEAVIVKDLNAVVTYWNRAAASLYGFSAEEAVGQPLHKLHAAELSELEYERLSSACARDTRARSTTERHKKSGETIRVAIKTTPLLNDQGALIGEITIARDVTERGARGRLPAQSQPRSSSSQHRQPSADPRRE